MQILLITSRLYFKSVRVSRQPVIVYLRSRTSHCTHIHRATSRRFT